MLSFTSVFFLFQFILQLSIVQHMVHHKGTISIHINAISLVMTRKTKQNSLNMETCITVQRGMRRGCHDTCTKDICAAVINILMTAQVSSGGIHQQDNVVRCHKMPLVQYNSLARLISILILRYLSWVQIKNHA